MIYLLFLFFVIMFIYSFYALKKEIFSPAVILTMVYVLSVGCAIYNIDKWDINLHNNTFFIFLFGTLIFVFVSILIDRYYRKKLDDNSLKELNERNQQYFRNKIKLSKLKLWGIIIFDIIIIIIMLYYIFSFANQHGEISSFSEALNVYRKYTSYKSNEVAFPFLVRQLLKFLQLSGFIFLYIYIKNIVISYKNLKKDFLYLIPILFTVIQSLMVSERLKILQLAATGVFLYFFLWSQKNNWKKSFGYKFYLRIFLLFVALMLGFYFVRLFIGRTSSEGLLTYVTRYAGGSIQLFDLFMQNPPKPSGVWGKETFYYLNENLHQFGFLEDMYVIHLEFRKSNNVVLGNVYTAYRRWIYDFGPYGAMFLQLVLACIYNIWYQRLKKYCTKNLLGEFSLILFSYLIFTLFMHPIDSNFYRIVVCLGFVLTTIEMFIIYFFFIRFDETKIFNAIKERCKKVKS